MELTKKAFDEMIARILIIVSSSKFWITLASIAVAVIASLNLQDPIWKAILAIIGVLTGGGYVASKTYQNVRGKNSPEVIIEAMRSEVEIAKIENANLPT